MKRCCSKMTAHKRKWAKRERQKSWSNGQQEIFSDALFWTKASTETSRFPLRWSKMLHKAQHVKEKACTSNLTVLSDRGPYLLNRLVRCKTNKKPKTHLCDAILIQVIVFPSSRSEIWSKSSKLIFTKALLTSGVLLPFSFFVLVFGPHGVLQL